MRDEELAALERYNTKLIISKLMNGTAVESNAPTLGFLLHEVARLLRRHGALAEEIIGDAREEPGLGRNFGGGLYESELEYLVRKEWAREAEDVLWRRTKCGLHMTTAEKTRVRAWLAERV